MADSDTVTLRHEGTREEVQVGREAVPFFTNQGFVVLDASGRVNAKATAPAAADNSKEK